MNLLTEKAFILSKTGIFSYSDILVWLGENRNSVKGLVTRAIAANEILHIRRGLYCLAPKYSRFGVSRNVLANIVYGPSYLSMESALSIHGWIPEAVHSAVSVSFGRARTFETPLGFFDYVQIKQQPFFAAVESRRDNAVLPPYLVAKPLKALADYVVSHGLDWTGVEPLIDCLRIDEESLSQLNAEDFDELGGVYRSRRARIFLDGLRKELLK